METDDGLRSTFDDPDYELLMLETGFRRPLSTLVMADLCLVVKTVKNHLLMRVKGEMDQFLEGLADCGVGEMVRKHPDLMAPRFLHTDVQLNRGTDTSIVWTGVKLACNNMGVDNFFLIIIMGWNSSY